MDLNKCLADYRKKHGREIIYNSEDDMFYEMIKGKRKPVRIESPKMDRDTIPFFISNSIYESRLSDADKTLRRIIIEHVDEEVCEKLAKDGHMEKRNGQYHPCHIGVCHMVWCETKIMLKEKYGIDWASPQDENPGVMFD